MKEEEQHINNIKESIDLNQSLSRLYEMHSKIYYKIIHKYFSCNSFPDKKKELIEECKYHIYFAALEYNPEHLKKAKFSSYLANKARWLCLNFFNSEKKKTKLEYENIKDDSISTIPFLLKKERYNKIHEEIEKDSDERVAEIFKIRYFESKNNKLTAWKVVSSRLSLSVQGCINIHNKFLKKLQNRIEK